MPASGVVLLATDPQPGLPLGPELGARLGLRVHAVLVLDPLLAAGRTELLDDPEVSTPVTMYLLQLTESLIDGRRFVYVMTEFWKRLGDPVFTDFAKDKQKTIRKQNGLGIFDTQSPADVLRSDIARALGA